MSLVLTLSDHTSQITDHYSSLMQSMYGGYEVPGMILLNNLKESHVTWL